MDGSVKIGVDLETKQFDSQINYIERKMNDLIATLENKELRATFKSSEIQEMEMEVEKLNNQLVGLYQSQAKYNQEVKQANPALESVNNTMSKLGRSAKIWVGAIFGVRSAYMLVRRAISLVSSQNDEVKGKLEAMQSALTNLLAPIVERIVNMLYTAMVYLDHIVKAWFGISLFSKANDKSLKSAVGHARALRKEMMGFDEMNVLNDSGGTGAVGGAGGGLGDLPEVEIPGWVQWIAENKDNLLRILKEIAIIFGTIWAIGKVITFTDAIAKLVKGFKGFWSILNTTAGGLLLFTTGILTVINHISNLIINWDTLTAKEKVLSIALATLGAGFIALGYAIMAGISIATLGIGALIAGAVALTAAFGGWIVKTIKANEESKLLTNSEKNLKKAKDDLKESTKNLEEAIISEIDALEKSREEKEKLRVLEEQLGITGKSLHDEVMNGTKQVELLNEKELELYKQYQLSIDAEKKYEEAKKNTKKATKENELAKKEEARQMEISRLATVKEKDGMNAFKEATVEAARKGKISWDDAHKVLKDGMKGMSVESKKAFTEDLPNNIKKGLEPSKFQSAMSSLGNWFKNAWAKISGSAKIEATVSGKSGTGSVKGVATGGVVGLATGGIINLPNQGVPLHTGVIGGESGAEGVIPLTNTQMMNQLGEAIGRYITVNFSHETSLNGRTLARETAKIQNQNDFIMNR